MPPRRRRHNASAAAAATPAAESSDSNMKNMTTTSMTTTTTTTKRTSKNSNNDSSKNVKAETTRKKQKTVESKPTAGTTTTTTMTNTKYRRPEFIMIISPAKTLDMSDNMSDTMKETIESIIPPSTWTSTYPNCDLSKTNEIISAMKQHASKSNKSTFSKMLGLKSDTLITKSQDYWNDMILYDSGDGDSGNSGNEDNNQKHITTRSKPCIFAFNGVAYQGLDIKGLLLTDEENKGEYVRDLLQHLQDTLRIVDPLYGMLKPTDCIQPYRLEMATKNVFASSSSTNGDNRKIKLANYWKPSILQYLLKNEKNNEDDDDDGKSDSSVITTILNLASEEYSQAIDTSHTKIRMINVIFQQHDGRNIAVHAKRARGLMVKYILQQQCMSIDDIKQFNLEGYQYYVDNDRKSSDDTIIFRRISK